MQVIGDGQDGIVNSSIFERTEGLYAWGSFRRDLGCYNANNAVVRWIGIRIAAPKAARVGEMRVWPAVPVRLEFLQRQMRLPCSASDHSARTD